MTTCIRLDIIKPEQAMRTHPDIGLMIASCIKSAADLLQLARFWLCTQPETPQTCCKLRILPACCKLSTSCSRLVHVINLQQACCNQACCKLTFADLMQVDETSCIKSANINLQQA
jgi:hypothetical protein